MTVQAQTNKILIENKIGRKMWVWDSDSFYTQRLSSDLIKSKTYYIYVVFVQHQELY